VRISPFFHFTCPFLFLLGLGLSGCTDEGSASRPPEIKLRMATSIERRATLSILRRAWADRPTGVNDDHCWYERRLLNQSGYFGRKVSGTEVYVEACQFWMRCVREHLENYDDATYHGLRGN
jgi:hypothetical protein